MKLTRKYIKRVLMGGFAGSLVILMSACNDDFLDRLPETEIGVDNFFNTEEDLSIYVNGLYNFPGLGIYYDDATDNAGTTGNREIKTIMTTDANSQTITSGWHWGALRSINLFLENAEKADIGADVKNHYIGVARFFRAQFYMEKVKRYSNVPWYDQVLETDSEDLFKTSDPRETVVDHIFEDYQFAMEHVRESVPTGAVDKWTVMAYYSRNALYEGTFRKYHSELGLEGTANDFLELAAKVSQDIADQGPFSIYNTGNPAQDYMTLFGSQDLTANPEVIFTNIYEADVKNTDDPQYLFGSYEMSMSRDLLETYLMDDGTYFSQQMGIETMEFVEEFQDRDPRLSQTFAYPGWELYYTATYSPGTTNYVQELKKNFTGYHQIKGFANDPSIDVRRGIDIPVLRYAEVLLNLAEARAELGTLNQGVLDATVNQIRSRAGMPPLNMAVSSDPVQAQRYPQVTDPVLLEIRRERRVEFAMEGRRLDDLNRWNAGKLMEKEPVGMYFPGLGKYDLTGDGVADIQLLGIEDAIPEPKELNENGVALIYYRTGSVGSNADVYLTEGTSGNVVGTPERGTFQEPKHYYRPIPAPEMALNPNLEQVFGWE
ncbi:MAG: RagB/SusD family nutrient uptake outer membrane protein [Muricauda sp.]|mgnify:CR=1 FL=1|nr:RagB/SusD family nutrient uptake outer membrane protein [Allomuricauda aurea]MAO17503.1 RagB/SusD family nutrient uptake outer membrane protein [Allomuricauda sp.]MBC71643.1 RagB/SusD family nutrient uptake outer membrane protein [Allomuricauda sp.]